MIGFSAFWLAGWLANNYYCCYYYWPKRTAARSLRVHFRPRPGSIRVRRQRASSSRPLERGGRAISSRYLAASSPLGRQPAVRPSGESVDTHIH